MCVHGLRHPANLGVINGEAFLFWLINAWCVPVSTHMHALPCQETKCADTAIAIDGCFGVNFGVTADGQPYSCGIPIESGRTPLIEVPSVRPVLEPLDLGPL